MEVNKFDLMGKKKGEFVSFIQMYGDFEETFGERLNVFIQEVQETYWDSPVVNEPTINLFVVRLKILLNEMEKKGK